MVFIQDKCEKSHKAADNACNKSTWKACDDTGLMGFCCWHDSVIYLANIHGTGENCALPLSILERVLAIVKDRLIGVLYNIGCSLDKFINLVSSGRFFSVCFIQCLSGRSCNAYLDSLLSACTLLSACIVERPIARGQEPNSLWYICVSCVRTWLAVSAQVPPSLQLGMGVVWWRVNGTSLVGSRTTSQSAAICKPKQLFELTCAPMHLSKQTKHTWLR